MPCFRAGYSQRAAPIPYTGGTFATPDILNNASFESDYNGFTDWDKSSPPTNVTRDNTSAAFGSFSVKRDIPASGLETSAHFAYSANLAPEFDRVWCRFYMKLTTPVTTIMKLARYTDVGINHQLGGLFLGDEAGDLMSGHILQFGTDQENLAICTGINASQAQITDGNYHAIEFEYWRNGAASGWPEAQFWIDGVETYYPDGTANVYGAPTNNVSYWSAKRLVVGARASSSWKLGYMEVCGTLNAGNTKTGTMNLDYFAYSSLGRIGP